MQSAPIPADEDQRLKALRRLHILDTGAEAEFDALVVMAASAFHAPIAAISFVDAERQWAKARMGPVAAQTARAISFCSHGILSPWPLIVCDATRDQRFAKSPLVTEAPHIRAYLGAPMITRDGARIGMMCVCAHEPRTWTNADIEHIDEMVHLTMKAVTRRAERFRDEGLRVCAYCLEVWSHGGETWLSVEDFLHRHEGWSGALVNALCGPCAALSQEAG